MIAIKVKFGRLKIGYCSIINISILLYNVILLSLMLICLFGFRLHERFRVYNILFLCIFLFDF